jgi:hypothetical protein
MYPKNLKITIVGKKYNKVICEAKNINNIGIRSSEKKSKDTWDLIKEELGEQ